MPSNHLAVIPNELLNLERDIDSIKVLIFANFGAIQD
jgi:hypothetical protein